MSVQGNTSEVNLFRHHEWVAAVLLFVFGTVGGAVLMTVGVSERVILPMLAFAGIVLPWALFGRQVASSAKTDRYAIFGANATGEALRMRLPKGYFLGFFDFEELTPSRVASQRPARVQ